MRRPRERDAPPRRQRRDPPSQGVLALLFTTYTYVTLKAEPTGNDVGSPLVDKYGAMIKDGAMAFLKEEYKWLSVFVVLLGGIYLRSFSVEDQHTKLDGVHDVRLLPGGHPVGVGGLARHDGRATDGNTRTTAPVSYHVVGGFFFAGKATRVERPAPAKR